MMAICPFFKKITIICKSFSHFDKFFKHHALGKVENISLYYYKINLMDDFLLLFILKY